MKKRCLLAFLIVLICGITALTLPSLLHPEWRARQVMEAPESVLGMVRTEGVNATLDEDWTYTVLGPDPQLYIAGFDGSGLQTVRLTTKDPIPAGTPCQLFYIPEGDVIREDYSVWVVPSEDTNTLWFSLPENNYSYFRLDLEASCVIEDLELSRYPVRYETGSLAAYVWESVFTPNWLLYTLIFCAAAAAAVLVTLYWRPISRSLARLNGNRTYRAIRGWLFCLYLSAELIECILYSGHTRLTDEGWNRISSGFYLMLAWGPRLLAVLLVAELLLDWRRALAAAALFTAQYVMGWITGNNVILADFLMLILLGNLATRKQLISAYLIACAVYIGILIWLNLAGLVTSVTTDRKKQFFFLPSINRGSSWGTIHQNTPGILVMSMMLVAWWRWRPKHRWVTVIAFWLAGAVIWYFTMNRTVTALMFVFPAVEWLTLAAGKTKRARLLYLTALLPLAAIGVTWFLYKMSGQWSDKFGDYAFWIRFKEWDLMKEWGVKPFGNIPPVHLYLDNFYTCLIISCGTVPTALVLAGYVWMTLRLVRRQEYGLLAIALLYIPYTVTEHALMFPVFFLIPILAFMPPDSDPGPALRPSVQQKMQIV